MPDELPNLDAGCADVPSLDRLRAATPSTHPPRILLLYGSLRERSYSRFLTFEAERLLKHFGAETRIFDPSGLPLPDGAEVNHPKVQELRELSRWSEGQVWTSPERHGAMSAVMKAQIDWIPLSVGAVRPTQGKTLDIIERVRREYGVSVASHLTCVGATQDDLRRYLTEAWQRGVESGAQVVVGVNRHQIDEPDPVLGRRGQVVGTRTANLKNRKL